MFTISHSTPPTLALPQAKINVVHYRPVVINSIENVNSQTMT